MERLYQCWCGLDVHKQTVVACLLRPAEGGQRAKESRTFGTMTADLVALRDWLVAAGCTHVAMESSGVYWKPVYNILEGHCAVLLVNAQHIKQVPGRKTDVADSAWIADLLQHGLLRPSFGPDRAPRELRALTRTRTTLIDERSASVKRLQAVLEDANLKLAGVATDIMGVSGREMLAALLDGETDPAAIAELARGRLRRKREALEQALAGRLSDHHRRVIALHLEHIDFLDEAITRLSAEIAERVRPFETAITLLDSIPGVDQRTAEIILAEIGVELNRFPSAGHLAAWAGMCPGQHESAGKRKRAPARQGKRALRRALTEAARAAARTKQAGRTRLAGQYRRLVVRCGTKKAAVAVGHTILRLVYHILTHNEPYQEPDLSYLDARRRAHAQQRALTQLRPLGFEVTLTPKDPAA